MISYEEAKAKALKEKSGLNAVVEYKGAWAFYNSNAKGRANTEDNEVMIRKSDGKRISMTEYIATTKDSSTPKKIKF